MGDAEPTKLSSDATSLKQGAQATDGVAVASVSKPVMETEAQSGHNRITSKPDATLAVHPPQQAPTATPLASPADASRGSAAKKGVITATTDQTTLPDPKLAVDDGDRDTLDAPPKQPLNLEKPSEGDAIASVKPVVSKGTANASTVVPGTTATVVASVLHNNATASAATHPTIPAVATVPPKSADKSLGPSIVPAAQPAPAAAMPLAEAAPPTSDDAAIARAREPLTKLYGKYIIPTSDTSLADARQRLKRAIEQTRILRQSFTERVYSKYRICLHPPKPTEQIISEIEKEPAKLFRELTEQTEVIREEKEVERQEAARLNADLSAADRLLPQNIENAEMLMYMTSGLNLVILPEDAGVDNTELQQFTERGPTDAETGQRARNISQASAIAAELVLDRTRKAAAVRIERQRLKQLQLLRGEKGADATDAAALFAHLPGHSLKSGAAGAFDKAKAPPSSHSGGSKAKMTQYHRPAPKGGRPRSQSSASSSVLLNLAPTADEVKITGKPSPATEALASRSVGPSAAKPMQVRLRHPHPDSLGGIRRAAAVSDNASSATAAAAQQQSQANVANTLPPLPAPKEQFERKPLPTSATSLPTRRPASLRHVLQHFAHNGDDPTRVVDVPKLNFLNAVRKFEPRGASDGDRSAASHPFLVVSVLHAVGLVVSDSVDKQNTFDADKINPKNRTLNSDRFRQILTRIKKSKDQTVIRNALATVDASGSAKRKAEGVPASEAKKPRSSEVTPGIIEAASIRGGGEVLADTVERTEAGDASVKDPPSNATTSSSSDTANGPDTKKRRRPPSPVQAETTNRSAPTPTERVSVGAAGRPAQHVPYQVPNNQVGRHPNAAPGDLAYLGGMPDRRQQLFDMQHQLAQGQLASFGFAPNPGLMGYPFDHTAATQAMLAREHQAAALLGSYSHGGFHPPAASNASMSSFLAASMPRAPVQKNSSEPPSSSQGRNTSSLDALSRQVVQQTEAKNASRKNPASSQKEVSESSKASASVKESKAEPVAPTKRAPPQKTEVPPPASATRTETSRAESKQSPPLTDASMKKTLEDVLSAAAQVPIPRGLVLTPLKERLNTPGFKNAGKNGAPFIDKDVVVAAILVWLWDSHGPAFQLAFETNGRFDVDPDCKWLIQAAVDTVVSELSLEIANSVASGKGSFAGLSVSEGIAGTTEPKASQSSLTVKEKVDFSTVSIVSKSLGVKLRIHETLNKAIANQANYVELLDEARMGALRAKSRERVLLANLLAQNTMVTDNFTNAYVSAVIRAGEALGHEKLFEIAHEEDVVFSTLTPQDIYSDDNGVWEDSCRPDMGFTESLTGDQLLRRAHARASIQKSMRKLQDRYQIRGGTPSFGPFMESQSHPVDAPIGVSLDDKNPASPRGVKRRASSMTEQAFIVPGTGSCEAKNLSDYEPKHVSFPLDWDTTSKSSSPYGIHLQSHPVQIASLRPGSNTMASGSISQATGSSKTPGTFEISWARVASTFRSVELPKKTVRPRSSNDHGHEDAIVPANGAIIAPFCTEINTAELLEGVDSDSGEDEDLSDATVLTNHQKVLDEMKGKLEAYLEERKKFQDKRKNRHTK